VRRALVRVVEGGTAGRLAGVLKDGAGQPITIGGKTGTGDHRFEHYGKNGQLIESRVVNRTATFVFYLGNQYFGTLTALVQGEQAGQFGYTSALTAQMLKSLLPALQPYLYPIPPKQGKAATTATPEPEVTVEAPKPVIAAPPAKRAKEHETPEGPTSQADPTAKEPPTRDGFPEDLEPSVVVPVPLTVPTPTPAPAKPHHAPVTQSLPSTE
jgi:membrane peptidoglycan carboxypeptidase